MSPSLAAFYEYLFKLDILSISSSALSPIAGSEPTPMCGVNELISGGRSLDRRRGHRALGAPCP